MKTIDTIKKSINSDRSDKPKKPAFGLSTGLTLTNLAMTGKSDVGVYPGDINVWVGDSQSGKSFLMLNMFACACQDDNFTNYGLYYENTERRSGKIRFTKFFGKRNGKVMRNRLQTLWERGPSRTVEEFYYGIDNVVKTKKPFILGLDSQDSLSSQSEGKKFAQQKRAHAKEEKAAGSYGDGKARSHSSGLRVTNNAIGDLKGILVLIAQAKDNIGAGFWEPKKVYSGGRSPRFFATNECWFTGGPKIYETILGKKRIVGHKVRINVQKNSNAGWNNTVTVRFYPSFGLDEIGSNIDYLVEEGLWKMSESGNVKAPDFEFEGKEKKLIAKIEEEGLERELQLLVIFRWKEVEEGKSVKRKPRFQ